MKYDTLLAKSHKNGHADVTLTEHAKQVVAAADALFGQADHPTRLGSCWLRFFGLDADVWPKFRVNLLTSCVLHDWGKANDGFQDEVHGKRGSQAIRHEHLSALLIGMPVVTQWLENIPLLDMPVVLSAVMTHHLKARNKIQNDGFAVQRDKGRLAFLFECKDFEKYWNVLPKVLRPENLRYAELPREWRFDEQYGTQNIREQRDLIKSGVLRSLQEDCAGHEELPTERQRMLIAVRAALIAADAAGSGLVREGKTIEAWIQEQFSESPQWDDNRIYAKIINPRIEQIKKRNRAKNKHSFEWNGFQLACDKLPPRALLLAPCGSGKTLAAWRWIAAQAMRRPVNRVLFLYPTRATAKEGFRDYVGWAPEADAALMHGTAEFDLQDMFENEDDPRHANKYETERRLFALGFWAKSAFSATVDQFLAFMQYSYSAVCMLPVLADSVVVIDEVHSFDRNMFSTLKRFLQCFDVPVLCMTATLTRDRRDDLCGCGLTVYNDTPDDLAKIADAKRYHLTVADSRESAAARVRKALAEGCRVLWVVNTVNRCHEVLKLFVHDDYDPLSEISQLTTSAGIPIYCYHSRFTLDDRKQRHEDIVANMKTGLPACLGITTQVCEMSLDLDVDLLVSEYCPVTSLIQRMGRCNRERDARPLKDSGEIIVYEPKDCKNKPYSDEDLTGLKEFLQIVRDKNLSQSDLEDALADERIQPPPYHGDSLCMFIESGPYASTGDDGEQFRDSEDFNRQCVQFEDVQAYLNAADEKKPGFVLPVPKRLAKSRSYDAESVHRKLPRYLGVAAPGHYHPLLGYCDRPLDQWRTK